MSSLALTMSLRGQLLSGVSRDAYAVGNYKPELAFDFVGDYFRKNGTRVLFDSALTATRAGNATMVDSDGKIKWAPHNLIPYSEDFSNVSWFKVGATVPANTTAAPDGSISADTFTETSGGVVDHSLSANFTPIVGQSYRFGVYAKQASGTRYLALRGFGAGGDYPIFDLIGGTIVNAGAQWSNTSITSVGNGWYYCASTVVTVSALTPYFHLHNGTTFTYAGDGTSGIYLWGAHLYQSSLGGMVDVPADARAIPSATKYVPTTSAARYLPRRGHHVYNGSEWVNEGLLVESEARTNLLTYSEQFDNAAWVKVNTTVSANTTTSPSGLTTACTITETASPNDHYINCTGITAAANWTLSVYVKKKSPGRYIQLRPLGIGTGIAYATFDPDDGSIYESGGTSLVSAVASAVGNGWHRVSITCSYALSAKGAALVVTDGTSGENPSYTGDGTSGIYIYGAQLEAGSTPSSYIPTAGATVTRAAETLVIPSANLPWPTPNFVGENILSTFSVVNGDWVDNLDGTWSVVSGSTGDLSRNSLCEIGKPYLITYTIATNNNLLVYENSNIPRSIGSGTYSVVRVRAPAEVGYIIFRIASAGTTATVSNVSVREINPLAVSIAMDGRMTYADTGVTQQVLPWLWQIDVNNRLYASVSTLSGYVGRPQFWSYASGVSDTVSAPDTYTPGINVPFNIASRHGSTFINGAVDGVALTADLTPVALPDLSATDLQLGYAFMGTIGSFRIWADDIGDAGLVTATNPSTEPSLLLTFDSAETSFVDLGWRN